MLAAVEEGDKVINRERDGIFRTSDVIHLVEATTTRNLNITREKAIKLADLASQIRRESWAEDKNIQIWLVLEDEPTEDQGSLRNDNKVRTKAKCPIHIVSRRTLFSKLVDALDYLRRRDFYAFGSARSLKDERTSVRDKYIPLDFVRSDGSFVNYDDYIAHVTSEEVPGAVLVGDFGSGKSMTLRQQYLEAAELYRTGRTTRFPVHLNLVDHHGQRMTGEAFLRHCNQIGFANANGLVGAWRAGFVDLYLDGFDELYSTRFVIAARGLSQARAAAVELVRRSTRESPRSAKVFLAGRLSFYGENFDELRVSLGASEPFQVLRLSNFSEAQVKAYLHNGGVSAAVPAWLPTRPLMLGYLLARKVIVQNDLAVFSDAAGGWNYMLDRITEREAEQSPGGISDGVAVRRFLERLAWDARSTPTGLGPITIESLRRAFFEVFNAEMNSDAEQFVFRLCGLTASSSDPEAREFFDLDFADACAAGPLARYVSSPYENDWVNQLRSQVHLGPVGVAVAVAECRSRNITEKAYDAVLSKSVDDQADGFLKFDLLQLRGEMFGTRPPHTLIQDATIEAVPCSATQEFSGVSFQSCIVNQVLIESDDNAFDPPRFLGCLVSVVIGRSSEQACPSGMFDGSCDIASFSDAYETNAQTLRSSINLDKAVLVTVLRKLFVQRGRARKENAFFRGVEPRHRDLVKLALDYVLKEGFATRSTVAVPDPVFLPNYSKAREALAAINSPQNLRYP